MLSGMTAIERMHGKARRRFVQPPDSSGGAAGMGGAATLRAPDGQHRPAGACPSRRASGGTAAAPVICKRMLA